MYLVMPFSFDFRFFYDFYSPDKQLSDSDFKQIKKEMDSIIKANLPFRREEVSREEARLDSPLIKH